MSDFAVAIVGGGLASARAIRSYREAGGEGRIALISQDTVLPYHRPPLSKRFLRGEQEATEAQVEPEAFYTDSDVELLLATTARGVVFDERRLELGHRTVTYDRLLLATGARPRRLDVPGVDLPGVFTLRSLADSAAIRAAATTGRDATVVGGGFIGVEVAASLRATGLAVTLLHRGNGLFQLLKAPALERQLVTLFQENDVDVVLLYEVEKFGGRSRVDSVTIVDGDTIPADVVVLGVGVDPVTELVHGTRLEVDDGIVVNERFETNVPGVYAVGDVARFRDPVFGSSRRIEHWSNADYQGTQIGKILAGVDSPYDRVSTFFSEFFGITINVFGDLDAQEELVVRGSLEERDLLGFYLDAGRLVATVTIDQPEETEDRLKELIRARARPRNIDALADPSIGLDELFAD